MSHQSSSSSSHRAFKSNSESLKNIISKLDEIKEFLETMNACVNHQRTIVDDTLNVSKSESGDFLLDLTSFQPLSVVDSAARMYRGSIDEKKLVLEVEAAPDCPNEVFNDAGRLREVIINLLSNAIKWTSKGAIKIKLSKGTSTSMRQGDASKSTLLQISVEDTGEGMSEEEISRLFQRFGRSKSSEHQTGSGLGLLIAKNLVSQMGGTIAVTSEKNKGSIFTFTINTDMSDKNIRKRSESSISSEKFSSKKRRMSTKEETSEVAIAEKQLPDLDQDPMQLSGKLLVVDSSDLSRRLLQQVLAKFGCHTEIAANGVEAMQTFNHESFDAIILDLLMPAMTGVEAMQVIREREIVLHRALRTPIIVLSEDQLEEHEKRKLIDAGADAVISKPIHRMELFKTLNILLGDPSSSPPTPSSTSASGFSALLSSLS